MENVNPQARFFQIDIRDPELADVFDQERPEVVCHLAAQHSVKISTDDPVFDAQVNILGLIHLLQCCTRFNVRKVVFSSSAAIYGVVEKMPIDEDTPQCPQSPYGITKMASEHYFRFWKGAYGLDFTLLRYGNVYGPRQDPAGEAGVIAIFAGRILNNEPVRIDWDGDQKKDYVYVRDVARANLLALEKGGGEAFCIATQKGTSVNDLYRGLSNIFGREVKVVRAPKRPGDVYLSCLDFSKAKRMLEWQPQTELAEGLRLTAMYFQEHFGE